MKYKEPITGREEPAFDNLLVVELGEQRILSQLHFFQRKYSLELARLPAELEYKRIWRREKHPSPPETDLDPGLADVQQVVLSFLHVDRMLICRLPSTFTKLSSPLKSISWIVRK